MKSSTIWHGHSTQPSLPAGTARKASGHLSGRRPLHLANARPFGRLKAPLGLSSLLRCANASLPWQAEQAHHAPSKEKQSVPDGERSVVHIAIVCGFWQGASVQGAPQHTRSFCRLFHPTKSFACTAWAVFFFLGKPYLENFMSRPSVIPAFRPTPLQNRGRNFVRSKRRSTYTSSGTLYLFLRLNNSETTFGNAF